MLTAKVIVHKVQAQHVQVVFQLFTESVGQPDEPAHTHTHGQVVTLNVRRTDCCLVRIALDNALACAGALGRVVFTLMALTPRLVAVQFHQHTIIHVSAERALNDLLRVVFRCFLLFRTEESVGVS